MSSTPPLSPSRTRLRRVWGGLRGGRPSTETDGSVPDPAVFDLVSEPFDSVDDAYRRLRALESLFYERDDRRGPFLVVYSRVTAAVGRDTAWRTAVALADSRFGVRRALALWFLRISSTGAAYLLLSPSISSRLSDSLRDLERG